MYTLYERNCARTVYDALRAGGFPIFDERSLTVARLKVIEDDDTFDTMAAKQEQLEGMRKGTVPLDSGPILPSTIVALVKAALKI